MGLLVFGIYLVYKLRNASGDVHKEKLVLCVPIFVELLVSGCAYSLRHAFWRQLTSNQLLALYFIRCQLTVSVGLALVFGPKVRSLSLSLSIPFSCLYLGPALAAACEPIKSINQSKSFSRLYLSMNEWTGITNERVNGTE